jgi:hypothetical protein
VSFFVSVWLLLYCRQCEFTEKKSISGARGSRVRAPALCVDAGGHPSETQEAQLWTKKTSARAVKMRAQLVFIYSNVPIILYTPRSGWLSGGSTPMPLIAGVWHIQRAVDPAAPLPHVNHTVQKQSRTREDLRKCAPKVTGRLFLRISLPWWPRNVQNIQTRSRKKIVVVVKLFCIEYLVLASKQINCQIKKSTYIYKQP